MPDRPAFEIGFVLAGAISVGCYSAGVMDLMIEALDDYYVERDKPGWDGPRHDVRVPVLAGGRGAWISGMGAVAPTPPWFTRPVRGRLDPTRRGLIRCRPERGGGGDGAAADRAGAAGDG